jgi:hypothetical protein
LTLFVRTSASVDFLHPSTFELCTGKVIEQHTIALSAHASDFRLIEGDALRAFQNLMGDFFAPVRRQDSA